MQPFPTLYSKKATGKIQDWKQTIEVDKKDNMVWLITTYGEIDGKKIVQKKPIKETKAKRTPLEEAKQQAKTTWEKKKNKESYVENIDNVNDLVVRPMLAQTYKREKKFEKKFPMLAQPKLDGNRALIYYKDGEIMIETRNGTEIKYFNHIRDEVKKLYDNGTLAKTIYLDGELFTFDLPFNEMNGLTNKKLKLTKEEEEKMEKIKYYIFDFIDTANLSVKNIDRIEFLQDMFEDKKYKYLVLVDTEAVQNPEQAEELLKKYMDEGYEGLMLRNPNAPYQLDKRTSDLLKYKVFVDEEFKIVGYEESKEEIGTVVWICQSNKNPKMTFNVRPMGSDEYRAQLLKNADKYIGKLLTVKFQEFTDTKNGIPRFPVGKDIRY